MSLDNKCECMARAGLMRVSMRSLNRRMRMLLLPD